MSHQTGIQADDDLKVTFASAKTGQDYRLLKVIIQDEKMVLASTKKASKKWDEEYDDFLKSETEETNPCYILYRLDSTNNQGYEWILLAWTPDCSSVRCKMLYAATRSTLKKEFGGGYIKDDIFATTKDEICLEGYRKHLKSQAAPKPFTAAEQELRQMKLDEVQTDIGVDTKQQTLTGVAFPIDQEARDALLCFRQKNINYIQLKINIDKELIQLDHGDLIGVKDLPSKVPNDEARYHLFLFKHSHEGDYQECLVFIYSMPGYKCGIKERMMYSSCKNSLIDVLEHNLEMEIEKKLEIDNGDELTSDFLYDEVHPKQHAYKPAFAKPKGPSGKRGGRRITRPPAEGEEDY